MIHNGLLFLFWVVLLRGFGLLLNVFSDKKLRRKADDEFCQRCS